MKPNNSDGSSGHGVPSNDPISTSNRVDFMDMDEKLFKARPKAVAALLRMGHLDRDEDMSDMESLQSLDEDRAWRSFVSSPNSTTPPSPSAGSSDSSASPSLFITSPVLRQRNNRKTTVDHSPTTNNGSSTSQQSLNGLRIQSACVLPDSNFSLNGGNSGGSDSSSLPLQCIPEPFDIITSKAHRQYQSSTS
jgi:hypothetical protein